MCAEFQPLKALFEDFETAFKSFVFYCESKGLMKVTIDWYSYKLRDFKQFIGNKSLNEVLRQDIWEFIHHLKTEKTTRTTKKPLSDWAMRGYVRAVKTFFKYLYDEEFIDHNPAAKIPLPKISQRLIPTFSQDQIRELLKISKPHLRDYTIILLLLDTGIRASELCNLDLADVDWQNNLLMIRMGKGKKDRQVPFGSTLKKLLWKWVNRRGYIPGQEALLTTISGERLGREGILRIIQKYKRKAKIQGVRCSPHTFRHTFAKFWILNGGDPFSLQRILGHTTMEMVRNYVNLFTQDLQTLHRKYSPVDRLNVR